jgi:hypothetical protein
MKAVEKVLDDVHLLAKMVEKSTRRKKRIRREHLVGAFHVVRVIINGVAAALPKAIPVAVVLNGLNAAFTPKPATQEIITVDEPNDALDGK